MILMRIALIVSLIIAQGFSLSASAATLDKVNELYQKSGMEEQIEDIALNAENGLDQAMSHGAAIKPEMAKELVALYKENFSADVLRPEVINLISQKMSDAQIDECLAWLNSPAGIKITQEEIRSSDPDTYDARKSFAEEFERNPPDAVRTEIITQLLEETHVLDYSASLMVNLQKTMVYSMANPADYANPRLEQVMNQIDNSKDVLKERIRPEIESGYYFTYKSIPIDELKQYIHFLSSDAGRAYMEISKEGLLNGMKVAGERLGKQLKERGKK